MRSGIIPYQIRRFVHGIAIGCSLALSACATNRAAAAITADQVLVVYNSAATGSEDVLHAYIAAHPDLPPENILDLNNAALSGANLTFAQFSTMVRGPIRDYLDAPGDPTARSIISILIFMTLMVF